MVLISDCTLGVRPQARGSEGPARPSLPQGGSRLYTPDGDKIPRPPVDCPMHHSLGSGPPCLTPERMWKFGGYWDSPDLQGARVRLEHFPVVPGPCWLP